MKPLIFLLLVMAGPALADPPVIEGATATRSDGNWQFRVTLRHPDSGWEHYADAWRIMSPDGTVLGMRTLAHPHETEQPFTRSLGGVAVPDGSDHVMVQARCLTDGWADALYRVDLTR
jgi:hypothetical protein